MAEITEETIARREERHDTVSKRKKVSSPTLTAKQVKEAMRKGAAGANELLRNLNRDHARGWARSRNLVVR